MDDTSIGSGAVTPAHTNWIVSDTGQVIGWDQAVLSRFVGEIRAGYQRSSWGGVEIGGLFLGLRDETQIRVSHFILATCSHENGPSLELSTADKEQLKTLFKDCGGDRLEPVGWFHSISNRQELLSSSDKALLAELFPGRRDFAVVARRFRDADTVLTLFTNPAGEFVKTAYKVEAVKAVEPPAQTVARIRDPFGSTPDPALFYASPQHLQAVDGLWQGICAKKGFLLLSGDSGMGKTMVLECLMDRLRLNGVEYGFLMSSRITVPDLFEMLWTDFGLGTATASKTSVLVALNHLLLKFATEGKTVALVLDDAHQLPNDVLQEIELLSNLETRQGKLLQVVFAARPEFEARLNDQELRGLGSRVIRRFRLNALSEQETAGFLRVRLKQANGVRIPEELFGEIHARTGGMPRFITTLCSAALERCRESAAPAVDHGTLEQAAAELGM